MSETTDKGVNAYTAYIAVALVAAAACCAIPLIALSKLVHITDSGMGSIAAMTFAPALLGIGVSFFI